YAGVYTVTLEMFVQGYLAPFKDTLRVTVSDVPPTISAGADALLSEGGTFARTFVIADPGSDTWTAEVWGDGIEPALFGPQTGRTVPFSHLFGQDGVYTIHVRVGNAEGNHEDSLTVTVENVAPTIESLEGPATGLISQALNFSALATDPGDDTLTYTWDFGDGSDPLAGVDLTAAEHPYAATGTYVVTLTVTDGDGGTAQDSLTVEVGAAEVVGRHVFYNGSAWDGNDAGASAADDAAIATNKTALWEGETAAFANYTSYARGINGVMIDVADLGGTPDAADFIFTVGNDSAPSTWAPAPAPLSISVRPGAGVGGTDRVTIIWAEGAIRNQWLRVTVLADANGGRLGLARDDVFHFGNAVGETGNSASDALVDADDEAAARANPAFFPPAAITNVYDFDRNRLVNAADQIIARDAAALGYALSLISVPEAAPGFAEATPGGSIQTVSAPADAMDAELPLLVFAAMPTMDETPPTAPVSAELEALLEAGAYDDQASLSERPGGGDPLLVAPDASALTGRVHASAAPAGGPLGPRVLGGTARAGMKSLAGGNRWRPGRPGPAARSDEVFEEGLLAGLPALDVLGDALAGVRV
ncbi:MAG: PKD domain-containing protein, partial [Planctomycetes bacterium]|nr:PKD domain-containing protein [Planctomycetota bacterium]